MKAVGSVFHVENRAMNVVARYGGDEFISVLSEARIEGARHFVARVQDAIATNETLAKFGISFSVGCAEFDASTMSSASDVFRAADTDMCEVKAARHTETKSG